MGTTKDGAPLGASEDQLTLLTEVFTRMEWTAHLFRFRPRGAAEDFPSTQTNGQRADRALVLLEEASEESLTDLLADLMHLAHREGWNFADCLSGALMHFLEER